MKVFWAVILGLAILAGVMVFASGGSPHENQPAAPASVTNRNARPASPPPASANIPIGGDTNNKAEPDVQVRVPHPTIVNPAPEPTPITVELPRAEPAAPTPAPAPAPVTSHSDAPIAEAAAKPEPTEDSKVDAKPEPKADAKPEANAELQKSLEEMVSNTLQGGAPNEVVAGAPAPAGGGVTAEALKIERREDGTTAIGDRFVIKGDGSKAKPFVIPWDFLVAAQETYKPRIGKKDLPPWMDLVKGKYVQITGYVAFPLMAESPEEMLAMLNQWDGCCIGVPPTPYDAIEVKLREPPDREARLATYGTITGRLQVEPYLVKDWLIGLYTMDDALLKLEK